MTKPLTTTGESSLDGFQYAQELSHPADQQTLVIDIDPGASFRGEDDMVAGLDWHSNPGGLPPVDALAHREDYAVLGRWFGGSGRDHEPGLAHALGFEFLDHHPVEERLERMSGHTGTLRGTREFATGSSESRLAAVTTVGSSRVDQLTAEEIARVLELEPLPGEGGMFRNTLEDASSTAIYFLVERDRPTMLHRLPGPETFHLYMGAPAKLVMLLPGGQVEQPVLGTDLSAGERPQLTVPGGQWQALESLGDWTLVGTTMAPGYREEDFELADRDVLLGGWPDAQALIRRYTPSAAP